MNKTCKNCDDTGWVCENHADKPWEGESGRNDACSCGAGMPCNECKQVQRFMAVTGRIPINGTVICEI